MRRSAPVLLVVSLVLILLAVVILVVGPFGAAVLMLAALFFGGAWAAPRVAFAVALLALYNVPFWISLDVNNMLPVCALPMLILAVIEVLRGKVRPQGPDVLFFALITCIVAAGLVGGSNVGAAVQTLTVWVPAYIVGRSLVSRFGSSGFLVPFALAGTALAIVTLVEFHAGVHPFVGIDPSGPGFDVWAPIQERGGVARAEWALGHSIALGGILVPTAAATAMCKTFPTWFRIVSTLVAVYATAVTLSRSALAGLFVLALAMIVFGAIRSRGRRILLSVGLIATSLIIWTVLAPIFDNAQTETADSSNYRTRLLMSQIGALVPLGRSFDVNALVRDLGGFWSVDNALLAVGLSFGWIPALLLVSVVLWAIARSFRRDRALLIVLLAMMPTFATVALITQYQSVVFLVVGAAAGLSRLPSPSFASLSADDYVATQASLSQSTGIYGARKVSAR